MKIGGTEVNPRIGTSKKVPDPIPIDPELETQPVELPADEAISMQAESGLSEADKPKKSLISRSIANYKEWRWLQKELRSLPEMAGDRLEQIRHSLTDYRLTLIDLSYKEIKTDDDIRKLFNKIARQIPTLKKTTRSRPLFLRSKPWLLAKYNCWQDLLKDQDDLTEQIQSAPKKLRRYDKIQVLRHYREKERKEQGVTAMRVDAARKSLEVAIQTMEQRAQEDESISYGSKIIRLEDAQKFWRERLEEFSAPIGSDSENAEEVLSNIYKLEKVIRDVPESARGVRQVEERFSNLIASHDMLVSFGKTVIPQKEIARTSVIMYEKVPKYWATGNREELNRSLDALDSFIDYYERKVQTELAMAERHRPGLTQALAASTVETRYGLAPLIAMARSMTNAIDARDRLMRDHSSKVARLAVLIGRKMNLPESELEYLELAGLLHDVGKLSIPENILTKTTPLTTEDWKTIQKHPYFGAQIVKPITMLNRILPWIYHHQEKWDGTGYPDRLSRMEIPLSSGIIALSEAFTVMTIDMPNRESMSPEEARESVKKEAGQQFNPEVVEAFLDIEQD